MSARRAPASSRTVESGNAVVAGGQPVPVPSEITSDAVDLSIVIGHHVRSSRKKLGLTLRGLSERSGLSIGFLSQLERGLTSISLTTLRDLAMTLGRDITDFFDEAYFAAPERPHPASAVAEVTQDANVIHTTHVAAPSDEPGLSQRYFTLTRGTGEHSSEYVSGQRTYRMLTKRARDLVLEPMLVTIAPGGVVGELEVHAGEEFAYVLEGQLCYTVEGVEHRLYPGDSLHLKSVIPHSLYNDTDKVAVAVSVVTPRLF